MASKVSQLFTVRNDAGQFLGVYRALSPRQAIQRLLDEQASYGSVFRGQSLKLDPSKLSAAVEEARF